MATQSGSSFSAWPSAARLLEESTVLITSSMLFIAYVVMVMKPVHFFVAWHVCFYPFTAPKVVQRMIVVAVFLLTFSCGDGVARPQEVSLSAWWYLCPGEQI